MDQDADQALNFPVGGISLLYGYGDQRPVQTPDGVYARTTRSGVNVRGFEALAQRKRGGSRPGLSRYLPAPVVSGWIVQDLNYVVGTGGTAVELSQSGRVVYLVAVSQGNVYYTTAGGTSWTQATIGASVGTPPLVYTGQVFSAYLNQQLWFADGSNWVTFQPSSGVAGNWGASAGQLPVDSKNNTPRLICAWRGRIVVAGLLLDPQQWFMSAVGDPTNWDYAAVTQVPGQGGGTVSAVSPSTAVSGGTGPMGVVPDPITALVPYSDDILIAGGDRTIYAFSGDPMAGGQIDLVTDSVGMAWGQAFCKDPQGNLYFFSNKTGIYAFTPGQGAPVRISQQIEQLVNNTDTGANSIRLLWNDRFQGFHVFITPLAQQGATTHLFWEKRTGAWWQDQFANTAHNPIAACAFDGNAPGDRTVLIGSWDGYVRSLDPAATADDGTAISSSVLIGPLLTQDMDDLLLKDIQALLGETSGTVTYQVFVGPSAEKALSLPAVASGTWGPGRNLSNYVRRAGHAVYVQVSSTNAWAMEQIRCRVAAEGKVRRRGA